MVPSDQNKKILSDLNKICLKIEGTSETILHDVETLSGELRSDFKRVTYATAKLKSLLEPILEADSGAVDEVAKYWSHQRHDLRTPVNAIKNYSEMMVEDLRGDKPTIESHLMKLVSLAESTLPLIEQLGRDDESYEQKISSALYSEETEAWYVDGDPVILVIDDNNDNREVLRRRLEKAGIVVKEACDGAEGLEIASNEKIDLILLDIIMPVMDGYGVLECLKSNNETSHIPVLMISSIGELSSIVRCIEAGAEDYLPTPFNPVLLKARITACLEKKKHTDAQRAFTEALRVAQEKLKAAVESVDEGFAVFDMDGNLIQYNQPFKQFYPEIFVLANHDITYDLFFLENVMRGVFLPDRRKRETPQSWLAKMAKWHKNPLEPIVLRVIPRNIWIEIKEFSTPDGGTVAIHKNVTAQVEEANKLTYLANHDSLTGLCNRARFEELLEVQTKEARLEAAGFGVMFIDLDGFKNINDTLGHEFGDLVLKQVAKKTQGVIRSSDTLARLGGDEFALITSVGTKQDELKEIAGRILEAIGTSVSNDGKTAKFGVSIGISYFPHDARDSETLLKCADEAMYAAKNSGKGHFRVFGELKAKEKTKDI